MKYSGRWHNIGHEVLYAFEEHAQNGHGVKRPAQRAGEFLSSLSARSRALCASKSIALAALEYAAHSAVRPIDSVLMKIEMPDDSLVTIEERLGGPLPANWPYVEIQTQQLGTDWLVSNDSIALEVPSIIIPQERNLILNPKHARFASEVSLVETLPFFFDPRIFNTGKPAPSTAQPLKRKRKARK